MKLRFTLTDEYYYRFSNGYIVEVRFKNERYDIQILNNLSKLDKNKKFKNKTYCIQFNLNNEENKILETCREVIVLFHKPYRVLIKYLGKKIIKGDE